MTTRQKIKLLRDTLEALDLTQMELATELEIQQSRISECLVGFRPIRNERAMALECLLRRRDAWPLVKASRISV